ncbi:MAG: hypothetical protein BAJALOKI3v1_560012 [Promethearchaeota archaeon]|nr:MAG: hypothetical protein BAJALOKI3v1_560012 [Candidatus Lokiarchaeota archaeon]
MDGIVENGSWKDACIKIGIMLEYLLSIWLKEKTVIPLQITNDRKKKWQYVTFREMIEFFMKNSKIYSDEIRTYTDWNLIKNILKDYRNYIHLRKHEKCVQKGDFLRKKEFNRIYPNFSRNYK